MKDPARNNVVILDFYQGAYGPTIRIDVQDVASLIKIKELFLELAISARKKTDLAELPWIKASGLRQLVLTQAPEREGCVKNLALRKDKDGSIALEWSLSSSGWKRCAGLIDGLIRLNSPAHQYLTEEGIDDAIIEIAFRE